MKKSILFISLLILLLPSHSQLSKGETKKWREDLASLHSQLQKRHVNLYHTTPKKTIDSLVHRLHLDIPMLQQNEILIRFAQIVASVGDGHTSFFPGNQKKMWFRFLPIKFWYFGDQLRVIATSSQYQSLLGKTIIKVGDTPLIEAHQSIATTIGADNPAEFKYTIPFELIRPELLQALGIIPSADAVTFTFDDQSTQTFYPIQLKEWQTLDWISANGIYPKGKAPSQRMEFHFASNLTIEHLKNREYYWYSYLQDKEVVFLQYNVCWDQKDRPTFAEVVKEMFNDFDSHKAKILIIDLRQNSGGEPATAQELVDELSKRSSLIKEKRVYVLIGRRTFSAALTNALQLRRLGVVTVGEPSRGKPNNPSEGRDIDLKALKMWATVSTQFVERDASLGDAEFIPIDIPVEQSFNDYSKGIDTAVDYLLHLD